jgi:hypothetical protein
MFESADLSVRLIEVKIARICGIGRRARARRTGRARRTARIGWIK